MLGALRAPAICGTLQFLPKGTHDKVSELELTDTESSDPNYIILELNLF